jgi:hypothetical protein
MAQTAILRDPFSAFYLPWRFTVGYQNRDISVKIFTFVLQDKGNREQVCHGESVKEGEHHCDGLEKYPDASRAVGPCPIVLARFGHCCWLGFC